MSEQKQVLINTIKEWIVIDTKIANFGKNIQKIYL